MTQLHVNTNVTKEEYEALKKIASDRKITVHQLLHKAVKQIILNNQK